MKNSKTTAEIYTDALQRLYVRTDRSFLYLFGLQWLLGVVIAVLFSPSTWTGTESQVHIHVWASIFLSAALFSLPSYLILKHRGKTITRHSIAVAQMLFGALLIHLLGGRIETHFHVFGSLAFLAFYKDWKVIVTASVVVALDHFLRGYYFPQSVYGLPTVEAWRWLEHSAWVIFEDVFLIYSCIQGEKDIWLLSQRQSDLEATNASIEIQIEKRTAELKVAYTEIDAQRAKTAQSNKMAAIGQMAGGIAHEINTPLATLQLLTSQLSSIEPSTEQQTNQLEKIRARIETVVGRIAEAITSLRKFAKESDHEPLERANADLIMHDSVNLWRTKIADSEIELDVRGERGVDLDCRPTQIKQVLFSLLSNSFDAVKSAERKRISLKSYARQGFIHFVVEDSGSGINQAHSEKIFEPFFTTKEVGSGAGLGLSVSLSIVESHGGTIVLDQTANPTRFIVSLPRDTKQREVA